MCQAFRFPCTSRLNVRFTMLSIMMGNASLSLASCITIWSVISECRSTHGSAGGRLVFLRFLPPSASEMRAPGVYWSVCLLLLLLLLCPPAVDGRNEPLLDFKVVSAVFIRLAKEHAQGETDCALPPPRIKTRDFYYPCYSQ